MKKTITTLFKILGAILIVTGIILTIVSLVKFDSDTFKIQKAMISGIMFPFVGIVMIIIATVVNNISDIQKSAKVNMDEIAKKMKEQITADTKTNSTSASKVCEYCGCKCKMEDTKCKNCGAELK